MAMSQSAVLEKLRLRMAEVSGVVAAYAPSQSTPGAGGVPAGLMDFPCAVCLPDETREYIITNERQRHTWLARILLLVSGADYSEDAYNACPFPDAVIEKMTGNVTVGGSANSVVFERSSGLNTYTWGGKDYLGYEFKFEVSETAAATVATGS